jgi:anti-sigma factor RsiW
MTTKRTDSQVTSACERLAVDLSAYFDGELEGKALGVVEQHLSGCAACTEKLEKLKQLRAAMAGLSAPASRRGSVLSLLRSELQGGGALKPPVKRTES